MPFFDKNLIHLVKTIVRSYTKNFENQAKFVDWNMKILFNILEMVTQFHIISIKPSANARNTINVCLKNRLARRIAGKTFWNKLLGTFEIECIKKTFEVVIDEEELHIFKNIICLYDIKQML